MRYQFIYVLTFVVILGPVTICNSSPFYAEFVLLQNQDNIGKKPSAPAPVSGDWLIGTADDQTLSSSFNPSGAWSHNLADLAGVSGAAFNMAPSLTGSLSLELTPTSPQSWSVAVTGLQYAGQATPVMFMNQFLVTPGSAATQTPDFNVDGLGNGGEWRPGSASNWEIQYDLDFYFATNADGDPNPTDIDMTFDDKSQRGYLLPVSQLTPAGLNSLTLDDPAGHYAGSFKDYLLQTVAPALPADATYLLVTQMGKTNPDFAEPGMPITTAGLVGNTTIAYTTAALPEPSLMAYCVTLAALLLSGRRR